MTRAEALAVERDIVATVFWRYPNTPRLEAWIAKNHRGKVLADDPCLAIVHPERVMDAYHVVVHDAELRERARVILPITERTNNPHHNAVLILCPVI